MAEEEITVRSARWEDLPGIVGLERTSQGAPHWGESVYRAIVADALPGAAGASGPRRQLLVAELRGGLAGFAVAVGSGEGAIVSVELESVLVAEELRRRGVGRGLCEAVIGWARDIGAAALDLEVRVSSGAAELYRRLGFAVVGRRPGYYRNPQEDALLMRLAIQPGE